MPDANALAARHTQTKMVALIQDNRQLRDALATARQSITDLELAVSQANHSIAELRACVARQGSTLSHGGEHAAT